MMRGIRRLVVYTAVSGLLAAGAVSATMEVAHADTPVGNCIGAQDTSFTCTVSATVSAPTAITVSVVDNGTTSTGATAMEDVTVNVTTLSCTDSSSTVSEPASSTTGATPLTDSVMPLPATADGQCNVAATVSLPSAETSTKGFVASQFSVTLSYTPSSSNPSPGPSPTPITGSVHPVKGFDGKCLDDKFNSSANRAVVVIWSCSGTDQAENWRFTSNELIHNNKCLNDQGNGGSRSKVILWTCNGASNEKWSELANGELKLQSHGGTVCLDDPASSTKNGTQLIVYTCHDSANQKWKLP
jgi:Ricin-type beta-trefoil lectin domain